MSHFYGVIQGNRGAVSRGGSKSSGFWGHLRGWNLGVRVNLQYDEEVDGDWVRVDITGGSNNDSTKAAMLIASEEDGRIRVTVKYGEGEHEFKSYWLED